MSSHNLWHSIKMYRDVEKDLELLVEEEKTAIIEEKEEENVSLLKTNIKTQDRA